MAGTVNAIECKCVLVGQSPYSQSKVIQTKKETGEDHAAFEERTWRERMHVDQNGKVFIPATALRNCLGDVAKYLSETVPGKGKATFTKHFESGVIVPENLNLGIKAKDIEGEWVHVPSDGKKGGGSRVWKCFPIVPAGWKVEASIYVFDPILISRPEKIHEYLAHAGKFIGMGRFRPRRGGMYGRFVVESFTSGALASDVAA